MKLKDKMINLYSSISNGGNLSTSELNNCGFFSNELTKLIKEGKLHRKEGKVGFYSLTGCQELFEYGLKLYEQEDFLRAIRCFKYCILIEPYHEGANFLLLLNAILSKKYKESIVFLENIFQNTHVERQTECEIILVLLNRLLKLSFALQKRAKLFEISNNTYKEDGSLSISRDKVIKFLINGDYSEALNVIEFCDFNSDLLVAIKTLIKEITIPKNKVSIMPKEEVEDSFTLENILECLNDKNFDKAKRLIHQFLESLGKSEREKLILAMVDLYSMLENSGYMDIMVALSEIALDDFKLNVENYIEQFEEFLHEKQFYLAKCTLTIISEFKELSEEELKKLIRRFRGKAISCQNNELVTLDEFYEVDGIQLLINSIDSGVRMEDTFELFQATTEQRAIVTLIYAKEAYASGSFKIGDTLMKRVEKAEKTEQIKNLFSFVRKNRQFFQNRASNRSIPYVILQK